MKRPCGGCAHLWSSQSSRARHICSRNQARWRKCSGWRSTGSVAILQPERPRGWMDNQQPFLDRRDAGRALASRLENYTGRNDLIVLALPRGGVPVAYEVAAALGAPLDVFLVRKLGTPGHRELAMGAIASGGVRVLNEDVVRWYGIPDAAIESVAREEAEELARRERAYRDDRPAPDLTGRVV